MVQVELNNVYISIGANNGSEKLRTEKKPRILVSLLKLYMLRTFIFLFNHEMCCRIQNTVTNVS